MCLIICFLLWVSFEKYKLFLTIQKEKFLEHNMYPSEIHQKPLKLLKLLHGPHGPSKTHF